MISRVLADLSNNNDHFDAAEYRHAGHVIVALKASEGTGFADSKHRGWALTAGAHHIAVIHYHFARPDRSSGAEEAAFFLHCTSGLLGPHDYVVYDGERGVGGGFGIDAGHCRAFDEHIQAHTRYHTILYSSASLLSQAKDALVGDKKRDWDANYSSQPDTAAPGHVCVMRQFTDGVLGPEPHTMPGIGHCDISVMRGGFAAQVLANAAH